MIPSAAKRRNRSHAKPVRFQWSCREGLEFNEVLGGNVDNLTVQQQNVYGVSDNRIEWVGGQNPPRGDIRIGQICHERYRNSSSSA